MTSYNLLALKSCQFEATVVECAQLCNYIYSSLKYIYYSIHSSLVPRQELDYSFKLRLTSIPSGDIAIATFYYILYVFKI